MNKEYKTYLRSDAWKEKRLVVLERANFKCENCGDRNNLEVHHKNYDSIFNERIDDLVCMCNFCHSEEHLKTVKKFNPTPIIGRANVRARNKKKRRGHKKRKTINVVTAQ